MAGPRNWLIVFNCTNIGLANSLKLLAPDIEVESIDFGRFRKDFSSWRQRLDTFDLILTAPHFVKNDCVDFSACAPVRTFPVPYFDAYHPDLCYVGHGKEILKGPLGDYHSKIITAAYKNGVHRSRVQSLFRAPHYEAFGYFDRWTPARQSLLDGFSGVGIDLQPDFRRWSLHKQFMHSVNHPAIEVVYDIASALLTREGIAHRRAGIVPHDNLMNGPIYPVFDEIAEHLSIAGSYLFKLPAQYRCIDLPTFIDGSYDFLERYDRADIDVHTAQQASFQRVMAAL